MKMIEDTKREETAFVAMTHFDDLSIPHICVIPSTNEVVELLAFEIRRLAKEKGIKLEDCHE